MYPLFNLVRVKDQSDTFGYFTSYAADVMFWNTFKVTDLKKVTQKSEKFLETNSNNFCFMLEKQFDFFSNPASTVSSLMFGTENKKWMCLSATSDAPCAESALLVLLLQGTQPF